MGSSRQHAGFTLVELLIVVIIMGILAAIVIPSLTQPAAEARESTVLANVTGIRRSIELYKLQHNESYPTADIINQLTQRTDIAGNSGTDFGPYILDPWPANPLKSDKQVNAVATMPGSPTGTEGWIYATGNGDFRCNSAGAAASGTNWFDL